MDLLKLIHSRRPKTIGVDGVSGVGKSTLAKNLAEALQGKVIPCDLFHKHDRPAWPQLRDLEDFEDFAKLKDVLERLQKGESFTLNDLYDYHSGTHIASYSFEPAPVLIVDGICVSRLPLDFKIFLDINPAAAELRAKERDTRDRGLTEERWIQNKRLFHAEYHKIAPELRKKADVVIDVTDRFVQIV